MDKWRDKKPMRSFSFSSEKGEVDGEKEAHSPVSWDQFRRRVSHQPDRLPFLYHEVETESVTGERLLYLVLDFVRQLSNHEMILRLYSREKLSGEKLGPLKPLSVKRRLDRSFTFAADHSLFADLYGEFDGFLETHSRSQLPGIKAATGRDYMQGFLLPPDAALEVLTRLHDRARLYGLFSAGKKPDPRPLSVMTQPWHAEAQLNPHPHGDYQLEVYLSQGDQTLDPRRVTFLAGGRFLLDDLTLYPTSIHAQQLRDWVEGLREGPAVLVARHELDRFIGEYAQIPSAPAMRWPTESAWREELESPRPKLRLTPSFVPLEWMGELVFEYRRGAVNSVDARSRWIDPTAKRIYLRDYASEEQYIRDLCAQAGVLPTYAPDMLEVGRIVRVVLNTLPSLVEALEDAGWTVEVENKRLHLLRTFNTVVEGTKDWLDLSISTEIEDQTYQLPALLKQCKVGAPFIPIGTSSCAILPETWMRRIDLLSRSGEVILDHIRLPTRQALLLDSLLDDLVIEDRSLQLVAVRQKIKDFESLTPCDPPPAFRGSLRDYQREGLAWLLFLQEFGFGGCLADDMGLGKTVQVLALLQCFYSEKDRLPSLIVVPRSLIGNWQEEAARFCPSLKVADFSAGKRDWSQVENEQIILVTYGTLRQDIARLHALSFAYVILDESQAIKNAASQTAKASFLLKAKHRLALSGTPIENHLGELGSLLQFLNPGLVEQGPWTQVLQKGGDRTDPHIKLLQRALRPLVLRRKKSDVLKDLPPKVEHTIYCELDGEQRRLYEELRDFYQRTLIEDPEDGPSKNSPLALIEALLRLRQAACHPALLSGEHEDVPSAKLEILCEKLRELHESGHKALIFSQFTSFLKIVAKRLQSMKIPYEYLDGQTRDRSSRVARFQSDPHIPFFLISLKAGGVGLNLTAADYCFILDPWWNPAVEAQAIDRAHRIHQTKTVFAYRLIAKGTVEEKIQLLQQEKKEIAAALLEGDGSLLQKLDLKALHALFA